MTESFPRPPSGYHACSDVVFPQEPLSLGLREVGWHSTWLIVGRPTVEMRRVWGRRGLDRPIARIVPSSCAFEDAVPRDGVSRGLVQDHQVNVVQPRRSSVSSTAGVKERRPELRLEVKTSSRAFEDARMPSPTARSLTYTFAVDQRVAVVQRR